MKKLRIRSTRGQKHPESRSLAERKRYVAFGGEAETGCGQNTQMESKQYSVIKNQ